MKNILSSSLRYSILAVALTLTTASLPACSSHHSSSETTEVRREPMSDIGSSDRVEVTKTEKISEETHNDDSKGAFGIIGDIFSVIGDIIALPFRALGAIF